MGRAKAAFLLWGSDCAWGGNATCPATTLGLLCSGLAWVSSWCPPSLGEREKKLGAVPIALCGAWELARPRAALVLSQQTVVCTCTAPALGHFLPLGLLLG